jgi:hypothetical protein
MLFPKLGSFVIKRNNLTRMPCLGAKFVQLKFCGSFEEISVYVVFLSVVHLLVCVSIGEEMIF